MEGIVHHHHHHHHHHNQQQQRKRLTLSEQMSVLDTSNLRDLSRVKDNDDDDDDDGRGRNALVGLTLGAVLGCEVVQEERRRGRINPSRTLLDIIKDEESGAAYRGITVRNDDQNNNKSNTWKSFKDRLLLRRAGAALSSSSNSNSNSNSIDDDCSRMEISRPSLTGIPSRSSFSIPTTVTTTAANSSVPAISNTSGIHGMEEEEIVEEINTNTVPAAEPVVMRLATALEAEREEEEQRRQTLETRQQEEDDGLSSTNVVVVGGIGEGGGEQVRMMNDESIESVPSPPPPPTGQQQPLRVSLMALLEETDRHSGSLEQPMTLMRTAEQGEEEAEEDERKGGGGVGVTMEGGGGRQECICCVCMVRHKGAAFIPCGHTFCRICSRKLWVNRGNCPLCNGYILEILDIF